MHLTSDDFRSYPPEARALVGRNLDLLAQLPRTFLTLLLREIIAYDWKFPAEQDEIDRQLSYLRSLTSEQRLAAMSSFSKLKLSTELEGADSIRNPARFSEQLSAYLWATHQIDDFSNAAESYIAAFNAAVPEKMIPTPRLAMVVIGREMIQTRYPLFRKLREHGTYFTNVHPGSEYQTLLDLVTRRAARYPGKYAHWCIQGAEGSSLESTQVSSVAFGSLFSVRRSLIRKMQDASALHLGPEAVRTRLAETNPASVGITGNYVDEALSHFSVSVLTEGSGTQIYSTTFVQWTAREALRRARPLTLLAKFAPRQTEESADQELQGIQERPTVDLPGSLIDADMGAYYTWMNLQRLPGAEQSAFLAWFEGHNLALAIAPTVAAGVQHADNIDLSEVLRQMQITS